jgi:iron complex outermembrane receptor protein
MSRRAPIARHLPATALAALALSGAALAAGDATTLREVTVSADADTLAERREAVTQKTVLDRAEIEALGGLTVGETIRKLPGIDAGQHTGDGAPSANARGLGRDSVQFLVDGERPSANARYALTLVGRMPAGELERIEILRGASAEHGGAAPVTVNLIMRKARPSASTTLKAAAGQRGSGGHAEANGQLTLSRGGGDTAADGTQFSWLLPLTVNRHGMPLDKRSERRHGGASVQTEHEAGPYTLDELILSPRLTWKKAGDSLTLWPSLYRNDGQRDTEVTRGRTATPGSAPLADGSRSDRESSELTIARLRAEGDLRLGGGGRLSARAALMGGWRDSDTARTWRDAAGTASHSREKLARDENEFSAALRLERPDGDALAAYGLEHATHRRGERQETAGIGAIDTRSEASQQHWTLWGQREWSPELSPGWLPDGLPAKALTLTAGLRGEALRLESDGRTHRAAQLAPSLAARLDAGGGWILRSSAGAGIKAPRLDEISALTVRNAASSGVNSPLEADRGGNPELRAERNINVEAGLERYLAGEAGVLGASVYWRRTEAFIERTVRLEGTRWVERPDNQGTAHHYGLELDAKLPGETIGIKGGALRAHLTLPRGRVADRRLGFTRDARELPRYQFTLGYDQALPFWQSSAGFQLTRHGRARTAIPDERAESTQRGTLLDAHWVRRLSSSTNLRLQVQNLLGADTRRIADARASGDDWRLATDERGQRTWLLSLEGKW